MAEARLGNVRKAEEYVRRARELDPDCYSLPDAENVAELAFGADWSPAEG